VTAIDTPQTNRATTEHHLAAFLYQTYNESNFDSFNRQYTPECVPCPDFNKIGTSSSTLLSVFIIIYYLFFILYSLFFILYSLFFIMFSQIGMWASGHTERKDFRPKLLALW
jgi:hypothetical protein